MWFQEAYSRSSVSTKCTGSMMRRPSARGRRVSNGKAEKEAEVRFLGLPGGNLQKYIDNYMLLH